jgi:endonuclease-3
MKIKKEIMETPSSSSSSSVPPPSLSSSSSSPYPNLGRPTKQETSLAIKLLSSLHGVPERCVTSQSVLDSLVRTILSQNTTDKNSRVAFNQLKSDFPTWKLVLAAPDTDIMNSIRFGGLAKIKTKRIKEILRRIVEEHPSECCDDISLDFLRTMPTEEIKKKLSSYNGVGPKTISCTVHYYYYYYYYYYH